MFPVLRAVFKNTGYDSRGHNSLMICVLYCERICIVTKIVKRSGEGMGGSSDLSAGRDCGGKLAKTI